MIMVLVFGAAVYAYFAYLLGPVNSEATRLEAENEQLEQRISTANAAIRGTQTLQHEAEVAEGIYDRITSLIPEGAPVAWFPPQVASYFRRLNVEDVRTRQVSRSSLPFSDDFEVFSWTIEIPRISFIPLGIALSGFENEFPLVEISSIQIETVADDLEKQRVVLSAKGIVRP